jgi:hypothetical protein
MGRMVALSLLISLSHAFGETYNHDISVLSSDAKTSVDAQERREYLKQRFEQKSEKSAKSPRQKSAPVWDPLDLSNNAHKHVDEKKVHSLKKHGFMLPEAWRSFDGVDDDYLARQSGDLKKESGLKKKVFPSPYSWGVLPSSRRSRRSKQEGDSLADPAWTSESLWSPRSKKESSFKRKSLTHNIDRIMDDYSDHDYGDFQDDDFQDDEDSDQDDEMGQSNSAYSQEVQDLEDKLIQAEWDVHDANIRAREAAEEAERADEVARQLAEKLEALKAKEEGEDSSYKAEAARTFADVAAVRSFAEGARTFAELPHNMTMTTVAALLLGVAAGTGLILTVFFVRSRSGNGHKEPLLN